MDIVREHRAAFRNSMAAWLAMTIVAASMLSCSLKPEARSTAESAGSSTPAKPLAADYQLNDKIKVDQFNDQATGKANPVQGGQIVVRLESEPRILSDILDTDYYAMIIDNYIQDSLLHQNLETFEWEPSLAERWIEEDIVVKKDGAKLRGKVTSPADDNTGPVTLRTSSGETTTIPHDQVQDVRRGVSFTFFLRKNVRFHDGQPMTADDVKFSFDILKSEFVDDPSLKTYYADLQGCEILDKYTVRLTYAKQYFMALAYASSFEILPKHLYDPDDLFEKDPKAFGKRFNESPYNRMPVGAGPYKFEKWETGSQVILTRNKDYFNPARQGHLDRLVFRFITDDVAALQALKNGEVDFIARHIAPEQFEHDMNAPDFRQRFARAEYYIGGFEWVGWNSRTPFFSDVRVRQAMAYGALNVSEYINKLRYGHGIVVTGEQYYFGPAYDHSIQPFPYDPEKAKQLLLEAGWYDRDGDGIRDKDGKPFRFEFLLASGRVDREQIAALMKENLRKLGIDMTIRELEWATFMQNVEDRKFDAVTLGWSTPTVEDDPYQIWHTSQIANHGDNFVAFGNAETDRLIEQARTTLDDTERHKIFFKFDRILYSQQPDLFLYMEPELGAYDKRYRGVKFYRIFPGYDLTDWFLPQESSSDPKTAP